MLFLLRLLLIAVCALVPWAVLAEDAITMRPSNGPLAPMLVAGAGAPIGKRIPASLVVRNPQVGWTILNVGEYVALRSGDKALAVVRPVGNGQQVVIQGYTGADSQLWKATNLVGILWTFAPKVAPGYVLQPQNGTLTLGTPLVVAPPTPGPGGVGVISNQMWVYPQR